MSRSANVQECCPESEKVTRTILPSVAISRDNVYILPLSLATSKQNALDFKCYQMAKVGPHAEAYNNQIKFKAGLIRANSGIAMGAQALAAGLIPGNASAMRSPARSTLWSAATPGSLGGSGISSPASVVARIGGSAVPDRGFRCSEGFQFGGQFTDKYFSTCGKKLFALALSIITGSAKPSNPGSSGIPRGVSVDGTLVRPTGNIGQVSMVRQPDIEIPKVGPSSFPAFKKGVVNVVGEMGEYSQPVTRLVRRDGVVLTPLVSATILRTVPDNRNMDGAAFITYASKPSQIGNQELGMFSNSDISSLIYVLPNGGTLALRKVRNLSNGERRKLGKLVAQAERMKSSDDPAARIEFIASEMDGPISYEQSFGNLAGANDLITVMDKKTKRQRQVRRWYNDAFLLESSLDRLSSRESQIEDEAGMVDDLRSAVGMINRGGQLGNISPELRIPALGISKFSEMNKLNDKITIYKLGRESVFVISPTLTNEHIGVMTAAEVQSQLGALAPSVWFAGSGSRRPYIISYPSDSESIGRLARNTGLDLADPEDMVRLMFSDLLTDTRDRNPSNLFTVGDSSRRRTFGGPVSTSGGAGMSRQELSERVNLSRLELLSELENSTYRDFFMRLRKEQRRRAAILLQEMLDRARQFNMDEFFRRMAIDGALSEAERRHMDIVKQIFESRIGILSGSLKFLRNVVNGV